MCVRRESGRECEYELHCMHHKKVSTGIHLGLVCSARRIQARCENVTKVMVNFIRKEI
jgi:hypothetical protein